MSNILTVTDDKLVADQLHSILRLDTEECDYLNSENLDEEIQFKYPPSNVRLPGANENNTYDIDLNTRVIAGPATLSVERDHQSSVVYFRVDRYFDYMDLANTVCVVEYTIPGDKSKVPYIYIVPFFDTSAQLTQKKMIFPWVIGNPATQQDGVIEYAIRFFRVSDEDRLNPVVKYDLHTLPAKARVLPGLDVNENEMKKVYDIPADKQDALIQYLRDYITYWHTLD